MIPNFKTIVACAALACASFTGCSTSTKPPTAEYVAFTTVSESNQAVSLASRAFATLYVNRENENEYNKFVDPVGYKAESARLKKLEAQFNEALTSYQSAVDAAVSAAIAAKQAGTPMETPSMAAAAGAIAKLIVTLKGGTQ